VPQKGGKGGAPSHVIWRGESDPLWTSIALRLCLDTCFIKSSLFLALGYLGQFISLHGAQGDYSTSCEARIRKVYSTSAFRFWGLETPKAQTGYTIPSLLSYRQIAIRGAAPVAKAGAISVLPDLARVWTNLIACWDRRS